MSDDNIDDNITGLTIFIVLICLFIVIIIKGVTVTDENKNIVNEHMSWYDFLKLYQYERDE